MVIQTLMKNAANAQNMIKEVIKTFKDFSVMFVLPLLNRLHHGQDANSHNRLP